MKISGYFLSVLALSCLLSEKQFGQTIAFSGPELLARPTSNSITINIVPDDDIEVYYEYGTISGGPYIATGTTTATGGQPHNVVLGGLESSTRYYYRMVYRISGGSTWVTRTERSFITQRASGEEFTFTVTSDSHVNIVLGSASTWQQTLSNIAADNPDFSIDLGDTYAMDNVSNVSGAEQAYLYQRPETFMGRISHSTPIFLAIGNHEQEEGWHLDDTGNPSTSLPVLSANARKKFFPNPVPDGSFYTGNTDNTTTAIEGDHLKEDYYAWQWGDALFIVMDPFWYTTTKPYTGNTGGGEGSDAGSGDRWDWTLGEAQFNWFKQTIENSSAKYKFVFAHHMVGGSDDYVRGGAVPAHLVEWGGYNENGATWGFTGERSEAQWGAAPIHQLMMDNDVSAFFHGHDHQYAYEMRDGIVYQSLPAAGFSGNGFNIYNESNEYTIRVLPSPGHLRVSVSSSQTLVEYIGTTSGTNTYSYTIEPNGSTVPTYDLTIAVNPNGSGSTGPAIGIHTYDENTIVNIAATPSTGYIFDHWAGNVADINSASTTVTMDANQSVTAYFTEDISGPGIAGDINGDDAVNSTDALITLSCDAGIDVIQFCPMNCADVNADGVINSTDALIILSYDAGMSVPYELGGSGCPTSATPCAGCNP